MCKYFKRLVCANRGDTGPTQKHVSQINSNPNRIVYFINGDYPNVNAPNENGN